MVKHVLGRFLAATGVVIGLLVGPAAAVATAAPVPAAAPAAPAAVVTVAGVVPAAADPAFCENPRVPNSDKRDAGCFDDQISANDDYLPSQRWAEAASGLHLRTGDGVMSDLSTRLQREATFPLWMAAANTMWMWSTNIVSWAVSMDLMKSVGMQVDELAAAIGTALFDSAILAVIVGVGIMVIVWRAARGRSNPWGYILRVCVILGIMLAMVLGSQASTISGGQYQPGKMSPGWIATTTNSIISSVASAPALAISGKMTQYTPDNSTGQGGILSCDAYVAELARQYETSAGGNNALVNKLEASVPMLLSRMWEQTGLEVWKKAQFGSDNEYGDYMYCRLLDERAGQGEIVQTMLTSKAARNAGAPIPESLAPNPDAAPWGTGGDVGPRDRSMIAWAACRMEPNGSWTIAGDWSKVTRGGGRSAPAADDCQKWWSEDFYTDSGPTGWLSGDTHNFEFSGKASDARNDTGQAPAARDFLLSLHGAGANGGGNIVMVIAYAFSSLLVLLAFLVIGGAVVIAKVACLVLAIAIIIVLLKDLLPGQEGNSAAARLAKTYLGLTFATFALVLLLALMAVITGFLVNAASGWFGGDSFMTITWTGAAPIISLVAIHLLFTKILKVPSPLTVNGAKAWGDRINSGAMGGAMTSAVTQRASRLGHAASNMAGRGARAAGSEVLRRTTGGRLGGGAPVARAGASVGTAATAAAAGGVAGAAVAANRTGKMAPAGAPAARKGGGVGKTDVTDSLKPVATAGPAAVGAGAPRAGGAVGPGPEALEGITDELPAGQTRAERKAARQAARDAVLDANTERRGYGNTRGTRVLGDAREAFSARLGDVRRQFADKPLPSTLRAGAYVGAVGAATVATGGLALPVIAAVSAASQTNKAREARRAAVENHEERRRVEKAASLAAERRQRQSEEETKRDTLQATTRTAVERRQAPRGASRAPAPSVRSMPRPTHRAVAGQTRQRPAAAPRTQAPAPARRPAAQLPPGGE